MMDGPLPKPSDFVEKDTINMNPIRSARRAPLLAIVSVIAISLAACSSASTDSSEPAASSADGGGQTGTLTVSGGAVEITAADLAFNADTIEAPAGEAFTVTFVNNDTVPHNFAVYTEEGGEAIVQGDIIDAGATVEVEVPALDAGEYFFVCDVHPAEMKGTIVIGG